MSEARLMVFDSASWRWHWGPGFLPKVGQTPSIWMSGPPLLSCVTLDQFLFLSELSSPIWERKKKKVVPWLRRLLKQGWVNFLKKRCFGFHEPCGLYLLLNAAFVARKSSRQRQEVDRWPRLLSSAVSLPLKAEVHGIFMCHEFFYAIIMEC